MKRLTVFNHFGLGDTFESREFILDWMRAFGVETCEYETRFPDVFEDLPQIQTRPFNPSRNMRHFVSRRNNHIILNSWIGALNGDTKPQGDYVIHPGVGCTVDNLHRMHWQYQTWAGLKGMKKPVVDYLTDIDYAKVRLGGVPDFVNQNHGKKIVLLANGPTGSQHAENFDMAKMVELLPESDTVFVFTERAKTDRGNILFTDDITNRQPGQSDFNAISYLSTFCSVIVGRCSGAQMVCETRRNWNDPSKTILSFTHHDNGASFVRDPEALGLKMKRVWSGASTPEEAAKVLAQVLE